MQQYKVLGAMLALGEFTVPQLVEASGAPETSVRSVLRSHKPWIEKLTKAEPGLRGGQKYVYRLVPEAGTQIREKLKELYPPLVIGEAGIDTRSTEADGDKARSFALVALQRDWVKLRTVSNLEEVRVGYRRLRQDLANAAADLRIGSHHAPTADPNSLGLQRRYEQYQRHADRLDEIISMTATAGETNSALVHPITEVRNTAAQVLSGVSSDADAKDEVLILESIPPEDVVTRRVRNALNHKHMTFKVINALTMAHAAVSVVTSHWWRRVILTMDSQDPTSRAPALNVMGSLFTSHYGQSTVVLDTHYDSNVQNTVLRASSQYVSNAADLNERAVIGITR
jgi:hypothetical protein